MLKKLAADALGLSDIGKILTPDQYDKADADDYTFKEDGEVIHCLIKTKSDEYCFTNLGLIHVDGDSAVSSKRSLKRYSWKDYTVTDVWLETAGRVDLDVEIKFSIGEAPFSIDVNKKQLEELKDLYKALYKIGSIQEENEAIREFSTRSLDVAQKSINRGVGEGPLKEQFESLNSYAFSFQKKVRREYLREDFGEVFTKYMKN